MSTSISTEDELALYVHWPFCISKCPYCDFNSHVVDHVDDEVWREALLTELRFEATRNPDAKLQSIFFGGGTPSLMNPKTTAAVIETAKAQWPTQEDVEITLEANPGTVDAGRFAAFKDAGVNRLSLGVQSLNDEQLKFLGRHHSAADARHAVETAGAVFDRLSFDLIYARPEQTDDQWRGELLDALDLLSSAGGGHLSCYQLTIEDNTPFKTDYAQGLFQLPDENGGSDLFDLTQTVLDAAGLSAYEVSNHAKTGDTCRHNIHVWQGGAYAGIGPGAHGRLNLDEGALATQRLKPPHQWLKRVKEQGYGSQSETPVIPRDRAIEMVMTGLRLTKGLDLAKVERMTGIERFDVLSATAVKTLEADGLIEVSSDTIKTTGPGCLVLNSILKALLT